MKPLLLIAVALLAVVSPQSVRGDDLDAQFAELRTRIEALELENKSLREAITKPDTPADNSGPLLKPDAPTAEKPTESFVEPQFDELEAELKASQPDCPSQCPSSSSPPKPKDVMDLGATWNRGLELTSKNKEFRVHVGGRTQFDVGWFHADENVQDNINNPYEDGADFRRARLRVDGTMYYTIDWACEYDFVNSFEVNDTPHLTTGLTDMWVTFREAPWVGNVRIGNQKPPIGFEHLVSSRFLPFMERSFNQDAFYGGLFNGFQPGISCFDNWGDDDMGLWQLGLFKPTNNVFANNAHEGDAEGVARLTRLLWYECEGGELLHVGGSIAAVDTVKDQLTFRTRDAIRSGVSAEWPVPASTGAITGSDVLWLNGELVGVHGPWTFQSEYLVSQLDDGALIIGNVVQPTVGTVTYHGGYAQVLYFLTGEHDNYNKKTAVFDRVVPYDNFYFRHGGIASGPGAWQVGVRYNFLDLNDNGINGGILHNATAGLNWFLNPNLKFQFDYMATHRDAALPADAGDGWIHGFGIRTAFDF